MIAVHIYGSTAPDGADNPFKGIHDCEIDLNPAKVVAILGDHGLGEGVHRVARTRRADRCCQRDTRVIR